MDLRPLGDRVVLEPVEEEEKSRGGIILPDTAKEKSQRGRVAAVGNGRVLDNGERQAVSVSVGDVVLYAKYSGTEVKLGGTEYLILSERDILAIVG